MFLVSREVKAESEIDHLADPFSLVPASLENGMPMCSSAGEVRAPINASGRMDFNSMT